jgi:hypothetical protein
MHDSQNNDLSMPLHLESFIDALDHSPVVTWREASAQRERERRRAEARDVEDEDASNAELPEE